MSKGAEGGEGRMGKPGLAQLWFPTKQLRLPLWYHNVVSPLNLFLEGGWASRSKETQKQLKQNCEVKSSGATGRTE